MEISGIKVSIPEKPAVEYDTYKIGDPIKVLKKPASYSTEYKSYPGVVIGFDEFKILPTLVIAYIDKGYSEVKVEFVYLNSQTKDIEICRSEPHDLKLEKEDIIRILDNEIKKHELSTMEAKQKKDYFVKYFNKLFADVVGII